MSDSLSQDGATASVPPPNLSPSRNTPTTKPPTTDAAAAAAAAADYQKTCKICNNVFTDPRLLPCLHTFCSSCIKGLEADVPRGDDGEPPPAGGSPGSLNSGDRGGATVTCPTCSVETVLPAKGPQLLPVDYMVQKRLTLDALNPESADETACDLCTGNVQATSRCVECMVNICTFCSQAHGRQRMTAGHTVLSMSEARAAGAPADPDRPVACPKHPQERMRMYCETCDWPVCRDCCLVEHRDHLVEYAEDVSHHHRQVLVGLAARLRPHLEAISEGLASVHRAEGAVHDRSGELCHDVNVHFDNYVQALQAHRRALLGRVAQVCEDRVNLLQARRKRLQGISRGMQHACAVTDRALSEGSGHEILALKPALCRRLSELNQVGYQSAPRIDYPLRFKARAKAGRVNGYEVNGVLELKQLDPRMCFAKGEGLYEALQGEEAEFVVVTQDVEGQPFHKGGEDVRATLSTDGARNRATNCQVFDEENGTYRVVYTPQSQGQHTISIFLDGQHIKGSPVNVTVHEGWREHPGIWHCCTFCSSEGSRQATCGCGGKMPGGFKGCGHGHSGHPGKWHWSCCGLTDKDIECLVSLQGESNTGPAATPTSPRPTTHTSPRLATHTSPRPARHTSPRPPIHTSPRPPIHTSPRSATQTSSRPPTHRSPQPETHTSPELATHASPRPPTYTSLQPETHTSAHLATHTSPRPPTYTSLQPETHTSPQLATHTCPRPASHTSLKPATRTSPQQRRINPALHLHEDPSAARSSHVSPQRDSQWEATSRAHQRDVNQEALTLTLPRNFRVDPFEPLRSRPSPSITGEPWREGREKVVHTVSL